MAEVDIDISGHTSAESCPVTPGGVKRIYWPLPDPAKADGTQEEIVTTFRADQGVHQDDSGKEIIFR